MGLFIYCDGTRSAPSALHFVPRYLQSALSHRPKLRFGPEKLISFTLFAAEDNNTLEIKYLREHSSEYNHSVFTVYVTLFL